MTEVVAYRLRSLVEAVGAWLFFEDKCMRQSLFSERYLTAGVGQFLLARYGDRTRTEYPHPVLAPLRTGRGDVPRIDFVVVEPEGALQIAVETKWLSESAQGGLGILRDMVRLEMLAATGVASSLIVAGTQRQFNQLFARREFQPHPDHERSRDLLPHDHNNQRVLRLDPAPKFRGRFIERALKPFHGTPVPRAFSVTRALPFPREIPSYQYVVYGWHVNAFSDGERETFDPGAATT